MNKNKLTSEKAYQFIHGGNSVFTVLNTLTKNRFTYKVKRHKVEDVYFVNLLVNPDTYVYIGFLKHGNFILSKKSKFSKDSQSVKVFNYIYTKLKIGNLPDIIEFWHEGKCGKCGRSLTVPESIDSGFGPECIKKIVK